ncbi:hypothetical protein DNFV4_04496 [Nitrospira tepida]|uniref:Uncharacterized protein n=1 Tax=Nitrospira tepida TaxID=2973512 RepID=A0AA86T9G1_9BACT|nr:hypothetical protein DNFV4_04496 [Nitrospira tepida]
MACLFDHRAYPNVYNCILLVLEELAYSECGAGFDLRGHFFLTKMRTGVPINGNCSRSRFSRKRR